MLVKRFVVLRLRKRCFEIQVIGEKQTRGLDEDSLVTQAMTALQEAAGGTKAVPDFVGAWDGPVREGEVPGVVFTSYYSAKPADVADKPKRDSTRPDQNS